MVFTSYIVTLETADRLEADASDMSLELFDHGGEAARERLDQFVHVL